jgi:hypothetical protein
MSGGMCSSGWKAQVCGGKFVGRSFCSCKCFKSVEGVSGWCMVCCRS